MALLPVRKLLTPRGRASLGGAVTAAVLAAPVLAMAPTWTSADSTPDFTISFSAINLIAGDTVRLQVQSAGGDWSSLVSNTTHVITAGELAAGEVDLGLSALANANYEARANVTHTTTSGWSNVVSFTILIANDFKFWFDGLPLDNLGNPAAATVGVKYWADGLPAPFIG
jgi:hypothetical protein